MRSRIEEALQAHPLLGQILEVAAAGDEPVYMVGGALRDMALGLAPRDLDFATARPFDLALLLAERLGSKVVALGKECTSTYRIPFEGYSLDWAGLAGGSIETDLPRRDFTVNAMAYDVTSQRFIDPLGGLADLDDRNLRMASPAAFEKDPARIVKAYRMFAQLEGFRLDAGTEAALAAGRDMILEVAPERVQAELDRLFSSPRAGQAVRKMADSGVLFVCFPEMQALAGLGQNDYHHADVLEHTLQALDALDGPILWLGRLGVAPLTAHDLMLVRLACLLHDTGKADTRTVDGAGRVHFYGHPKPSAEKARAALKRLRFSNAVVETVADLCLNHLRPLAQLKTQPRQTAMRRLVHTMEDRLGLLFVLAYADKLAAKGKDHEENLRSLESLAREALALARDEGPNLRRLPKLLSGLEAADILGLKRPGPDLGHALDALMERQVDGAITNRIEAEQFLRGWRQQHLTSA